MPLYFGGFVAQQQINGTAGNSHYLKIMDQKANLRIAERSLSF